MSGSFRLASEVKSTTIPFGVTKTLCDPASTGARQLAVLDVVINAGQGHGFHIHPEQEEVIYVVAGSVEQWIDREKRLLGPGDSIFVPAGVVHASFAVGKEPARIVAIFGPCVGDGFTAVDVAAEAPWKDLR